MRTDTVHLLINIFNAIAFVLIILAAFFAPYWWLAIALLALYVLAMYWLTQYEKSINVKLDELWTIADNHNLDARDLNQLLNYTGKTPLARTQTGNRQYYLRRSTIETLLAQLTTALKLDTD